MSAATDDLTPLLVQQQPGAVRYGQGTLVEWNPDTFENVVEWRGGRLVNRPVRSAAQAIGFTSGISVGLLGVIPPGGGAESWWIDGQIITPGTGAAEQAIAFMTSSLASAVAAGVLGARFYSHSIPLIDGTVTNPGSTYTAANGPELTGVDVSDSGLCLLKITARVACQINQPNGVAAGGWMSVAVSGATTRSPADDDALEHDITGPAADVIASSVQATRLVLLEGLNPGLHTISARYRSEHVDPPPDTSVIFSSRNLTAWAL
jgi:hypothetical protein